MRRRHKPRRLPLFGTAAALLLASGLLVHGTVASAGEDGGGRPATTGTRTETTAGAGAEAEVAVAEYDLGDAAFTEPETGAVNELRAVVHYPRQLTGQLPLIVMSHGSWYPCWEEDAGAEWPCEPGESFPSYRGYDYLAAELAANGFVVASISVDGIEVTNFAGYDSRAHLINAHLGMWQRLATDGDGPLAGAFVDPETGESVTPGFTGHVDTTRVGTLGHSRGGKAVMWQAADKHQDEWPQGVRVGAVIALAPVKFDPPPDYDNSDTLVTSVPFAAVAGGCDGGFENNGNEYLDDIVGLNTVTDYGIVLDHANHNYYNTSWTPPFHTGFDDSNCPDEELTPSQQQGALTTYALAFYRHALYGDDAGLPILTGDEPLPQAASTARVEPAQP